MNKYLLLAFLFLFTNSVIAQHTEAAEDSAYAVIEAIPEIQALIKNDTDKVWHFTMRTTKVPSVTFKYYWIQVGKTNDLRFYTQFNFYVDPKNFEVLYLDTRTNKTLTLQQLRELEKQN